MKNIAQYINCKKCKKSSLIDQKKEIYLCKRLNMLVNAKALCSHAVPKEESNYGEEKEK